MVLPYTPRLSGGPQISSGPSVAAPSAGAEYRQGATSPPALCGRGFLVLRRVKRHRPVFVKSTNLVALPAASA